MVKGPEYYQITVDCIFEVVIGLFLSFFFPREVRICIYWIFQRRKRHKNYHSIESAHLANTVNSPQLPVTEASMPAGAQSESRAQSPDASEKGKHYGLMSRLSFRLHHILGIAEVSRIAFHSLRSHRMGRKLLFCRFSQSLFESPPPQQSTINVAEWHFKVCYRHFKGASWASRTAFIRVVQVPLFAHAALCYSLVN